MFAIMENEKTYINIWFFECFIFKIEVNIRAVIKASTKVRGIANISVYNLFSVINKLHIEKVLPLIYTSCGYRAGQSN